MYWVFFFLRCGVKKNHLHPKFIFKFTMNVALLYFEVHKLWGIRWVHRLEYSQIPYHFRQSQCQRHFVMLELEERFSTPNVKVEGAAAPFFSLLFGSFVSWYACICVWFTSLMSPRH